MAKTPKTEPGPAACWEIIDDILSQLQWNDAITEDELKGLCQKHPVFQPAYQKRASFDPRKTPTWSDMLFSNAEKERLTDFPRAALKLRLVLDKFELIDVPPLPATSDRWLQWFGEVNSRLLRGRKKDLRFIGGLKEAIEIFDEVADDLCDKFTIVYNTKFTRTHHESGAHQQLTKGFDEIQRRLLAAGKCTWLDIVLDGPELEQHERTISDLQSYRADKRYDYRMLTSQLPLFQGLVIRVDNDPAFALVGWMFPGSQQTRVYRSDDKRTAEWFYNYLSHLYAEAKPSEGPQVPQS
jgi:hypothetical protein